MHALARGNPREFINGVPLVRPMRADELDIPDEVASQLVSAGFSELHPPQAEAIPLALEGRNLVAAIPTASGKSLIGIVPALKMLSEKRGKVLYIVPLKALASEKRDDFQRFADALGFKVHLSTGDLDGSDAGLEGADVVVATSEKADSMLRHGSGWIGGVRMIVADEIHMIHDPGRGPTLEVALTKMMRRNPDVQVIALSATVSNAEDVAQWLDAKLVTSDWRPVPLREGVYLDGEIEFDNGHRSDVPGGKPVEALVTQTVASGGQCLVFVNSRRSTESLAEELSLSLRSSPVLTEADRSVLRGEPEATEMGLRLERCVSGGTAFHNAGLTYRQRRAVEEGFKSGRIKCIVATPTLAAGINLPARRVIVRDTTRFETGGTVPIPIMEVKQMCGRAGRPGYDPYGEAILVAKGGRDAEHLKRDYIGRDPERITSKLFAGNMIRSHTLGLLATGDADSEESIVDFLRSTFFGATSQMFGVEDVVSGVVDFLEREGLAARSGDAVSATRFGKRVSDLCIDPVSAVMLREAVGRMKEDTDDFLILAAAAMTPDVLGMNPRKADQDELSAIEERYSGRFLNDPDDTPEYLPELFDSDLKVALLLRLWTEEVPEKEITDALGVGPGDIRSRVDMMDWIVYAMGEVAYIFNPDALKRIKPLMARIRYGVRGELVDLVSLRGVGRTRARILYDAGYRSRSDVALADVDALAAVKGIGPALAAALARQTGERPPEGYRPPSEEELLPGPEPPGRRQSTLSDFGSLRQHPLHVLDGVPAAHRRRAVVDDRVRVLQAVPGANAHDALVPVDHSLGAELPEPGDRRGGGRLNADALPPAQQLLRGDDLVVGHRGRVPSGRVDGGERLPPADRVADAYRGRYGLGVLLRVEVPPAGGERPRDRARARGLDAREHRHLVDPPDLLQLRQGLVHRPDVRRVPHREYYPVGHLVGELVHYLEQHRLLALRPVRVDRVEQVQPPLLGHPPGEGQRVVEVAVDGQHLGAEEQRLRQLAHGYLTAREEHRALDPGLRGVRRQRGRRVPGGRAPDDLRAELHRVRHADGHPAVLERAGGVEPLELDVRLLDADLRGQGVHAVQGGAALLYRDAALRVHRHERGVPPHPDGRRAEVLRLHLLDLLEVHPDRQEAPAPRAVVDERVVDLRPAIPAYDSVRSHLRPSRIRGRAP